MSNLRHRLPPLNSLAAFEAAARHGSFTRAAMELNLTQAAVSRQIRVLEEHLGVALFERRRHDVGLTPDGERYARTVNPAVNAIGDATAAIKVSGESTDQVVICSEICLAAFWLVPRLSRFQALHPDLDLRLLTSNRPMETESEPFDVALQYGLPNSGAFESHALCRDEIIVVCSPAVRRKLPEECQATDLVDLPMIHLEQPWRGWVSWGDFLAQFGATIPSTRGRLVFSSYNSVIDAAIEGSGLALGWGLIVEKAVQEGKLVQVGDFSVPSPNDLCAHLPTSGTNRELAEHFVAWIKAEIEAGGRPSQAG